MATRDHEYWQKRFERFAAIEMAKAEKSNEDLKDIYTYMLRKMQDEVIAWYARYADENGLSLTDARRQLDARELKAFKLSLKEYTQLAQDEQLSKEFKTLLDQASIRVRLDRSQMLYVKMAAYVEQLAKRQETNLSTLLKDVYADSYYKSAYLTQQAKGTYETFAEVPESSIDKAISSPWAEDGKDFSTRIWENKTKLLNTLHSEIARTLMAKEGTAFLSARIAKRFNVSFENARRLAETETAYVQETARMDSWTKLGVGKYQILATLDSRTSDICRHMDGKIFDRKDAKPGVTMPPFHCYCRTTTIPYIKGVTDEDAGMRAAREDGNGKTVHVPADMKYEEWFSQFVARQKGDEKIFAQHDLKNGIIQVEKTKLYEAPYAVTAVVTKKGGKTWNFYDEKGAQYLQVSDNDHGHKKESEFGKHGEHAHRYIIGQNGNPKRSEAIEVPDYVRKALGDKL